MNNDAYNYTLGFSGSYCTTGTTAFNQAYSGNFNQTVSRNVGPVNLRSYYVYWIYVNRNSIYSANVQQNYANQVEI